MKIILIVLVVIFISGCVKLKYHDPDSDGILEYSSAFKSSTDVQVILTSPEKTIAVSIGSTSNDQVIEQISDLVKTQKESGEDK